MLKKTLLLVVLVAHVYMLNAQLTCQFGNYDFSSLTVASGGTDYQVTDASGNYVYEFNICAPVANQALGSCNAHNAMICQLSNTGSPVATVAQWASNTGSPTWSYISASNPSMGIALNTANGDVCFPTANDRTAAIVFSCGSSKVGAISVSSNGSPACNYTINFSTSLACSGGGGGGGSPSKSTLSGGWIFFIIVVVCFFLYVVLGCVWYHRKTPEASLKEKCPHNAFWFELPSLVKDGCLYSVILVRECVGKCSGGSNYSSI